MHEIYIALTIVASIAGVSIIYTLINLLQVCDPSEVLIVSGLGKSQWLANRRLGYSCTKGGRMVVYPVVNKAHRMDLRNMTIDVSVHSAYSKDGIPLNISGVANIKISGDQPLLNNAVERFLGRSPGEIMAVAKETLEGTLRGVLARLTPEQVNHDKEAFAQSLIEEAEKDLQRMGLVLDNLKIQNVRDDVGYLDCLGRKKQAEVMMRSRIAEAENRATSKIREAENREQTTVSELESKMKILQAEADTRIADALSKRSAEIARQNALVAKEIAKAEAEIAVQRARIEQARHQQQADIVQPADAARQRMVAEAKSQVAPILENGKATAEMLRQIITSMKNAGGNARDIFLIQKIDALIEALLRSVQKLEVNRLTVIDQRLAGGEGLANAPAKVAMGIELLKNMGIDIPQLLQGLTKGQGEPAAKPATQQPATPAETAAPTPSRPAPQQAKPAQLPEILFTEQPPKPHPAKPAPGRQTGGPRRG
ncbi:MAG: flotillin family protein [Candidatus Riflebacteria bacterium]|nr:flotillin family protein [Candidatus Riflebacteria bacterium]